MTPIEEGYFVWLYSQVASEGEENPSETYWQLLRTLYEKEFLWFIRNDDNRCEDGKKLRVEYFEEEGLGDVTEDWVAKGCSMLEILVALARRLDFEVEEGVSYWFWKMMENLELERYNDRTIFAKEVIDKTLNEVIFRTYKPNGHGGLFPLREPKEDQTKVELWYQLNAYLVENME